MIRDGVPLTVPIIVCASDQKGRARHKLELSGMKCPYRREGPCGECSNFLVVETPNGVIEEGNIYDALCKRKV